jgi:hypothetical protein
MELRASWETVSCSAAGKIYEQFVEPETPLQLSQDPSRAPVPSQNNAARPSLIFSSVGVATDGVWMDNWIYWALVK